MTKRIIGLCGLIGSGKGTVADILRTDFGYVSMNFADSLKDCVSVVFGWDRGLLEGDTKESREWREAVDSFWSKKLGRIVTPRFVLQYVGTECFREVLSEDVWINSLEKKLLDSQETKIVITDCRFINEINMIRSLRGEVYHVKRDKLPLWHIDAISDNTKGTNFMEAFHPDVHKSEYSLAGLIDNVEEILNIGTIEDLKQQAISKILP